MGGEGGVLLGAAPRAVCQGFLPPPPSQNPHPLGQVPRGCCVLTSGSPLNGRKEILILGKGWTRPFPPAAVGRGTRHRHIRHSPCPGPSQQSHPQTGSSHGRDGTRARGQAVGGGGDYPSPPDPQDPLGGPREEGGVCTRSFPTPRAPGAGSAPSPSRSPFRRAAAPVQVLSCGAVRGRGPGGLSCSPAPREPAGPGTGFSFSSLLLLAVPFAPPITNRRGLAVAASLPVPSGVLAESCGDNLPRVGCSGLAAGHRDPPHLARGHLAGVTGHGPLAWCTGEVLGPRLGPRGSPAV